MCLSFDVRFWQLWNISLNIKRIYMKCITKYYYCPPTNYLLSNQTHSTSINIIRSLVFVITNNYFLIFKMRATVVKIFIFSLFLLSIHGYTVKVENNVDRCGNAMNNYPSLKLFWKDYQQKDIQKGIFISFNFILI